MMPPLQSLATSTVADELRGGVLGVYQSVINLSIIVGIILGGVLFAMLPTMPYWVATVLTVIALLPAGILFNRIRSGRILLGGVAPP